MVLGARLILLLFLLATCAFGDQEVGSDLRLFEWDGQFSSALQKANFEERQSSICVDMCTGVAFVFRMLTLCAVQQGCFPITRRLETRRS